MKTIKKSKPTEGGLREIIKKLELAVEKFRDAELNLNKNKNKDAMFDALNMFFITVKELQESEQHLDKLHSFFRANKQDNLQICAIKMDHLKKKLLLSEDIPENFMKKFIKELSSDITKAREYSQDFVKIIDEIIKRSKDRVISIDEPGDLLKGFPAIDEKLDV